ncbi:imidazole glycerol phosphate synthase subunit HisH [Aquirufa sp. OSTEICH-129V]|uniref:Imidazole glycerol phosphate synthase subunit HisH n=1 Tax=Aquirufa avitistagni TaxID=3104728 RepID=A0ABW6DEH1_9BACT
MTINNKTICIVDYKLGNLFSVKQALENIGLHIIISSNPEEIKNSDALVLPGVGSFKDAMNNLDQLGLIDPIKSAINEGKPFLGICLGLQLLFSSSEEFGECTGLDIIKGKVKKFPNQTIDEIVYKVPQIAWNQIYEGKSLTWKKTPLGSTENAEYMYFVHSYYVQPEENVGLTYTTYGSCEYVSSILKENIFACQFHPEKSGEKGLEIYKRWAELNNIK